MSVKESLETRYKTQLARFGRGSEARTYRGGGMVFKVYAPQESNSALREYRNMVRAGLKDWAIEHFLLEGHGIVVLKEYPGNPFSPEALTEAALQTLAEFFDQLHSIREPGETNRDVLEYRLELFAEWLNDIPEALKLIAEIKQRLDELVGIPLSFCHKDPWAGNILLKHPEVNGAYPPALVVDWARAAGEDPARDLAIFKTGSLDLLGQAESQRYLRQVVRHHRQRHELWGRLQLWVPLTYLHDLYWFKRKEPAGFEAALAEKLPRALDCFQNFERIHRW